MNKLPSAIDGLRRHPGMFLQEVSFSSICAFLEGYDQALERCYLAGFREWLVMKLGSGSNFWWPELVARLADAQGRLPEEFVFELLAEFLAERGRPDGLRNIFQRFEAWVANRPRSSSALGSS